MTGKNEPGWQPERPTCVSPLNDLPMILNRRSFLRWSLGTGLGLHSIAPARSRSLVSDGLHPISPERVVVLTDTWEGHDQRLEAFLRASLSKPFDLHSWFGVPMGRHQVAGEKIDPIFRLMREMTDYYGVPHLFPKWATMLAHREALASTGIGHGFGLLHQFQDDGMVQLTNSPVDWWLFLFPQGVRWEAVDDRPVFGMVGQVFPPNHFRLPALKLRTWELSSRVGWQIAKTDGWERIAKLDRLTVAQVVNQAILGGASAIGVRH